MVTQDKREVVETRAFVLTCMMQDRANGAGLYAQLSPKAYAALFLKVTDAYLEADSAARG